MKILSMLIGIFLSILYFIFILLGPILFPILGIFALDNSISWISIIVFIYTSIYIWSNIKLNKLFTYIILYIFELLWLISQNYAHPILLSFYLIPLLESFLIISNIITTKIFKRSNTNNITEHSNSNDNFVKNYEDDIDTLKLVANLNSQSKPQHSTHIECKVCGKTIIESNNDLCEECNTMLQEIRKEKASKKFCTNCGNQIKNNWNYCYHCGNKLIQEE